MHDPTTAIAWGARTSQFGRLVQHGERSPIVAMEFLPLSYGLRASLANAWLALPKHGNVLEPLGNPDAFLLRYAALTWGQQHPPGVREASFETLQVFQLASVYRMLFEKASSVTRFFNPIVKFDLGGHARVGFLPWDPRGADRPPEWQRLRAVVDERALVYMVGKFAQSRIPMTDRALRWEVVERCLAHDPERRFQTLGALMDACRHNGIEQPVKRTGTLAAGWNALEQALGWLAIPDEYDYLDRAAEQFQTAIERAQLDQGNSRQHELILSMARWGRDLCFANRGRPSVSVGGTASTGAADPMTDQRLEKWRSAAAWHKRDFAFGDLRKFDDARPIIAMEYSAGSGANWDQLREAWLSIERPCAILDALTSDRSELLVRFAALNWKLPQQFIDTPDRVRMACAWIIDLVDAHKVLAAEVPDSMPWFLNPVVRIDLNLRPRISFLATPPERHELPPEVVGKHATWDERTLVFQVGRLMKRLVRFYGDEDTPFRHVITACCQDRPWKRWRNLDALVEAVGLLVPDVDAVRDARRPPGWDEIEEGLGWLDLGENELAIASFRAASPSEFGDLVVAGEALAQERLDIARDAREHRTEGVVSGSFTVRRLTETPAGQPTRSPPKRSPTEHQSVETVSDTLERARAAFRLGDIGHAAALAHQVRMHDEFARPAALLIAEVHLRRRQFEDALGWLEPFLVRGDDARAEYMRAKAMFASGRLHEAHDGFERALKLAPSMIEAMLLRREVDRAMSRVRSKVGQGEQVVIAVPEGLEELRELLLSGDARRAIATLDDARFHANAEAQLVLARFLAMDDQHERALGVFDRITGEQRFSALLGKASTLVELDRDESALAIYEQLVTEKPTDVEASEGRARALEKLGRIGKAAAEYRRFISLATAGSDLRVRAAQAWLDAHPL